MKNSIYTLSALMLDLDGTLYVGPNLLPETKDFLGYLNNNKIPHLYLTNNSSQSAAQYAEKLKNKGIPVKEGQVLTSGDATIRYLKIYTNYKRIYLIGTPPLEEDFRQAGFILDKNNPDCVVMGFDTAITYEKLEIAAKHLYAGLPYFATQPDITCITEYGLTPDVGVFIAGLKVMTGREPIILGKPSDFMVEAALERMDIPMSNKNTVAMVGDQLDTDITMGVINGLISVLVLSGETDLQKVHQFKFKPSLILNSIGDLIRGKTTLNSEFKINWLK